LFSSSWTTTPPSSLTSATPIGRLFRLSQPSFSSHRSSSSYARRKIALEILNNVITNETRIPEAEDVAKLFLAIQPLLKDEDDQTEIDPVRGPPLLEVKVPRL
jgi:hypothetical protein